MLMNRPLMRMIVIALAMSISLSPALAWRVVIGTGENEEGLVKLLHSPEGHNEAEVYFRCEADSGWIFFLHDYVSKKGNPPLEIGFGEHIYRPSFKVSHDEIYSTFYFDAAIPSNYRGLKALSKGSSLSVFGFKYSAKSPADRTAIETFLKICDGND